MMSFHLILSVQFSCLVVSNPERPHGLQHTRLLRDLGSIPGLGRTPERGIAPHSIFWPGELHGRYSLWGRRQVGHNWATFTLTAPRRGVSAGLLCDPSRDDCTLLMSHTRGETLQNSSSSSTLRTASRMKQVVSKGLGLGAGLQTLGWGDAGRVPTPDQAHRPGRG